MPLVDRRAHNHRQQLMLLNQTDARKVKRLLLLTLRPGHHIIVDLRQHPPRGASIHQLKQRRPHRLHRRHAPRHDPILLRPSPGTRRRHAKHELLHRRAERVLQVLVDLVVGRHLDHQAHAVEQEPSLLVEAHDAAHPQAAAPGLGVVLGARVQQQPRGLDLVQVQLLGDFERVVDELGVDLVRFAVATVVAGDRDLACFRGGGRCQRWLPRREKVYEPTWYQLGSAVVVPRLLVQEAAKRPLVLGQQRLERRQAFEAVLAHGEQLAVERLERLEGAEVRHGPWLCPSTCCDAFCWTQGKTKRKKRANTRRRVPLFSAHVFFFVVLGSSRWFGTGSLAGGIVDFSSGSGSWRSCSLTRESKVKKVKVNGFVDRGPCLRKSGELFGRRQARSSPAAASQRARTSTAPESTEVHCSQQRIGGWSMASPRDIHE